MIKTFFIFLFISLLTITGCAQEGSSNSMSVEELKERMKKDTNLVVLDVRTEPELKGELGKIDGIVHIPLQELDVRKKELEKYKDKDIAIICRSGNRSRTAQNYLKSKGFENVHNVEGGMIEYRKQE